ncbi:MAG TPA: universal stress protein [Gemmatimonadales bacterium]|nr:universal stress protein [Gemmatimonadales bacterium]
MLRRIIVPLDGSAFAETAIPAAAALARGLRGHLELVMVHSPALSGPSPTAALAQDARIRSFEEAYVIQKARSTADAADGPVASSVLDGPVAPTLIEHVRARKADLVVMTTHGRAGLSRFFLGSVADRLVRELHCPILLLPPESPQIPEPGAAARILIPLDGSALAASVLGRAAAVLPDAALELVRVVVLPATPLPPEAGWSVPSEILDEELSIAAHYLEDVAATLRARGRVVHTRVLSHWSPAAAIADYAEERHCDLVALATRGGSGLQRALLGSVADKIIRSARLPVLVWNPPAGAPNRKGNGMEEAAEKRPAAVGTPA